MQAHPIWRSTRQRLSQCAPALGQQTFAVDVLNMLTIQTHDPEKKQRITLLETLPAQPAFRDLGYPIISAPAIFKNEQPKATPPAPPAVESAPKPLPFRAASPATSADTTSGAPANGSWSTKAATNGKGAIDVSSSKVKPVRYMLRNAEDWRLDERLAPVPSSVFESLKKKRQQGGNACNDFYLLGKCPNEYTCNFVSPRLYSQLRLGRTFAVTTEVQISSSSCLLLLSNWTNAIAEPRI